MTHFPANAYLGALLVAWLLAFFTFPMWRKLCVRLDIVDAPGHRKIHSETIPLAGGLTVLFALFTTPLLGWIVLVAAPGGATATAVPPTAPFIGQTGAFLMGYGFEKRVLELLGLLVGAAGMLLVGLLDDRIELSPAVKFAGQALIAGLVAACGVRATLFIPSQAVSYIITILWILTVVNAFNFMDNMNGLCAGLGSIAAATFAGVAIMKSQYLVGCLGLCAMGALLGFLPYNFPRAKAFLGDGGSHLTGYLMAVMGILPHFHSHAQPRPLAVLTPLVVLAVPLLDMAWVVMLRWRMGKPFYQGDTNHLSHRLVRLGLSRTRAVMVIWVLAGACGTAAMLLNM